MKKNVGGIDKTIRIVIGIISLFVSFSLLDGTARVIGAVVGVIALATALTGFCGLYTILGISTCPVKQDTGGNDKEQQAS